jgi:hypothetical protein
MFVYVGFDDTDTKNARAGTGKLARRFEQSLPETWSLRGVVRQQHLIDDTIAYTSHNSSACAIVNIPDICFLEALIGKAVSHLEESALEGSDPGLCVACENDPSIARLVTLGRSSTHRVLSQRDALEAAKGVHLSAHGGRNDGIIGAAAAVGLTACGWSGRFIEFGGLHEFPEMVKVADLERSDILVVSVDRDAPVPAPDDVVFTNGWLRPRLWGNKAVVIVTARDDHAWPEAH